MDEIRLTIGGFWESSSNIESDITSINWNIENNKNKKIVVDLPVSYLDSKILEKITNLDAIEFESRDGHRYKPNDILITNDVFNNMINGIKDSMLSPFEKFISIYSFVTNYKPYNSGDDNLYDIGRSPYLFLNDEYINCVGICQFLCILCRQVGINITMFSDEENEHAICYFYLKDDKYGIDGYFCTDPTNDTKENVNSESSYHHMIRRITVNNDFEKFLNSNIQLSYPKDMVDIGLFSKYVSFLKKNNHFIENNQSSIDLINTFRDEYSKKTNYIGYDIIYNAIIETKNLGYIPNLKNNFDTLKNMLFIQEVKEKILMVESANDLISSFANSSLNKKTK